LLSDQYSYIINDIIDYEIKPNELCKSYINKIMLETKSSFK